MSASSTCVGILEEQLRLGLQSGEGFVGVAEVKLRATASLLTDGEVDHGLAHLWIPDGLRRPGTAYLAELLREETVDACHVVCPVDEVVRGHEHQPPVVAPSVFFGPLPLRGAYSFLLAEDVEVGHGNVELAVRCAADMWVTYAMLLGDAVAADDGLAIVHRRKRVAVIADGHEQRVRRVAEISEEIGAHVLLRQGALGLRRHWKGDESR